MDKKLISQRLHQIEMFLYGTIKYTMLNFIVTPPTSTADGAHSSKPDTAQLIWQGQ